MIIRPAPNLSSLATRLVTLMRRPEDAQNVTLVLGSGVTGSVVPGVPTIVASATRELQASVQRGDLSPRDFENIEDALRNCTSDAERYGILAEQLDGIGQGSFDTLVRLGILQAYSANSVGEPMGLLSQDPGALLRICERAEQDHEHWSIPEGVRALAQLIASMPIGHAPSLVTTNFDPLLEVALRSVGLEAVAVDASSDSPVDSTISPAGLDVYHVHGFWRGTRLQAPSQMLHLDKDLEAPRSVLAASLADRFREGPVMFLGYGGWQDVFAQTINRVHTRRRLEVLWSQFGDSNEEAYHLKQKISGDITAAPNSVVVYKGIDSDRLFREVRNRVLGGQRKTSARRRPKYTLLEQASDASTYGRKAATLAQLLPFVQVPPGFAFFVGDNVDAFDPQQDAKLTDLWEAMQLANPDGTWIVRSSAAVEDNPRAVFPGRFKSVGGVRDFPALRRAVAECLESVATPRVAEYIAAMDTASSSKHMALIIQQEVECLCSGVAFYPPPAPYDVDGADALVEMTKGTASELLNGEAGTLYQNLPRDRHYRRIAGPELEDRLVYEIMSSLVPVLRQIHAILRNPDGEPVTGGPLLDVEWAYDGLALHVLQARHVEASSLDTHSGARVAKRASERPPLLLPGADELGSKAAAAQFFSSLGIGARNTTIIYPGAPEADIAEQIRTRAQSRSGTVIRFSVGSEVGVPKRFVAHEGDVLDAFMEARDEIEEAGNAAGIISDFVFVRSSFEAYLDLDSLVVEHVPANWEADSKLSPDLFLWTPGRFDFFRVKSVRKCKVELPSEDGRPTARLEDRSPLEDALAEVWAARMVDHFSRIRAELIADLPLNVHFIADEEEVWRFLNIRPTHPIKEWGDTIQDRGNFKPNRFYLVDSVEDVEAWDHASQILVTAAPERRSVDTISKVGRELRSRGVTKVFCSFGILSHPAIVLRELGIEVRPLYEDHERRTIQAPLWDACAGKGGA